PVFYPRAASKEFLLMRVEVPAGFPEACGRVDFVAGGLDSGFKLQPYNRIGLQSLRYRLDDLAYPLRNGSYAKFWRHYRVWRQRGVGMLTHCATRQKQKTKKQLTNSDSSPHSRLGRCRGRQKHSPPPVSSS